jgi:hypothetical protein
MKALSLVPVMLVILEMGSTVQVIYFDGILF